MEARLALSVADAPDGPDVEVETAISTDETLLADQASDTSDEMFELASQSGVAPTFARNSPEDPTPLRAVGSAVVTRGQRTLGFTVKFNGPVASEPALDVRNYRVFEVSKPDRFLSTLLYQDSDVNLRDLPIGAVNYVAGENTVVLLLKSPRKVSQRYRIGLASPDASHPVRDGETPLATLTDTEGHPISVPLTRRGVPKRGPITLRPKGRISLDKLAPGNSLATGRS